MDLSFNETQLMLQANARELLSKECPSSLVRALEHDSTRYSLELWNTIARLGWLGLIIPEKYGGSGGNFLDLAALLEEMGRALMPGPFFSTVVLGALTLLDVADENIKDKLLPKIAEGDLIMTLAIAEREAPYEPQGINLRAHVNKEDYVLNGEKFFVPDAQIADLIIVVARTSSITDNNVKDGITLFIVPRDTPGLTISPHHTLAAASYYQISCDSVQLTKEQIIGDVDGGWNHVEKLLERASVAKSLEMLGGAKRVLDMTIEYLKKRVQFGRPVGTFQGIQHHCANMSIDVEGSKFLIYQAAWKLSEQLPISKDASVAKAWISDAYLRVCALAHQCHGAIGFTQEHDLQLFTRSARLQEQIYGDSGFHRRLLSQTLI